MVFVMETKKLFKISLWLGRFSCGGLVITSLVSMMILSLITPLSTLETTLIGFLLFPLISFFFFIYVFIKAEKEKYKPSRIEYKGLILSIAGLSISIFSIIGFPLPSFNFISKFFYELMRNRPITYLFLTILLNVLIEKQIGKKRK